MMIPAAHARDPGQSHFDSTRRAKDSMPATDLRPIATIAHVMKPVAAGDTKRAALFTAGLLSLLADLRRRRHQR